MTTFLIIAWITVPVIFFLFALWSKLEQSTRLKQGKKASIEHKNFFKQGIFLALCSFANYLFDQHVIEAGAVEFLFTDFTPKPLVRFLLYPATLVVAATLVGGTKGPQIQKTTHTSKVYKSRH